MTPTSDELQAAAELIAANLPVVNEVASQARTYYTNSVTPENVAYWLLQFREPQATQAALRLLQHLHFIDAGRLNALLADGYRQIPESHQGTLALAVVGKPYDSGSMVGYSFAKNLGWTEEQLATRWVEIGHLTHKADAQIPTALAILDDNLTSGTQLERYISEMFPEHRGTREHLKDPLPAGALDALRSMPIYVVVAIELGDGAPRVREFARAKGLEIQFLAGATEKTRWLEYGCKIWESKQDADRAKELIGGISAELLKDKGWDSNKLGSRLLGYGNLQRLTLFAHNIPKSLITPLWKAGVVNGRFWSPLFPERGEWAASSARIIAGEPELRMLARLICSGAFGRTRPACRVAIEINGEPVEDAVVPLPDKVNVDKVVDYLVRHYKPAKGQSAPSGNSYDFRTALGPSNKEILDYNRAVGRYNEKIPAVKAEIRKSVENAFRLTELPLRVYNEGTGPATETVVRLELPDSVGFVDTVPGRPEPPKPPARPTSLLERASLVPEFNAEHSYLRQIRDRLGAGGVESTYLQFTRDRGRRILNVFFGRVLQGTFRDRVVRFLRLQDETQAAIHYELVCNESGYPVRGVLSVRPEPHMDILLPRCVRLAWFSDNES